MSLATGSACLDARCPEGWEIVAVVERPRLRYVELVHQQRGVCYVALVPGAPVPTTFAELKAVAVAPGHWEPQGAVVGRVEVGDE